MPDNPTPLNVSFGQAIALLERAGMADLPGTPGSIPWAQALVNRLCELSSVDSLTGVFNRRYFESIMTGELDRVARVGTHSLLLIIDIDNFKGVNDRFGHSAGDEVIRAVAGCIQGAVRSMDTVARLGGEEFAVVLPSCPPAFAETVADRICRRIAGHVVEMADTQKISVTVSVGGAFAPQWVRSASTTWMSRADAQMYRAKQSGRNRVCMEAVVVSDVSIEEKQMLFLVPSEQSSDETSNGQLATK